MLKMGISGPEGHEMCRPEEVNCNVVQDIYTINTITCKSFLQQSVNNILMDGT